MVNEQQKAYLLSLFNQLSPELQAGAKESLTRLVEAVEAGDRTAFDAELTAVSPTQGPMLAGPLWQMLRTVPL